MKIVFKILGNYFLNLLALVILSLWYIPNIIFQIIKAKDKKSTLLVASKMQFEDAYAIDVFGANVYAESFNICFVKKEGTKFGAFKDKTISWYFADNKHKETLTIFGYIIYYLIIIFDFTTWTKGGHFNFYKK